MYFCDQQRQHHRVVERKRTSPSRITLMEYKKVPSPIAPTEKQMILNQWLENGEYSLGCPDSWVKFPDPIRLQSNVKPPSNCPAPKKGLPSSLSSLSTEKNKYHCEKISENRLPKEHQSRMTCDNPTQSSSRTIIRQRQRTPGPRSMNISRRFGERDAEEDRNANTFGQKTPTRSVQLVPSHSRKNHQDDSLIGLNNSNQCSESDNADLPICVLYLYPPVFTPPANNEEYYFEDGEMVFSN